MKAIRWHARRDLRLDRVAEPALLHDDWVRIRPAYCGICGSDLEEYVNGPRYIPLAPHPLSQAVAPLTLGHEFFGSVTEVGPAVHTVRVGAMVAVEPIWPCGQCVACRQGFTNRCPYRAGLGQMADGGLAELVCCPASLVVPILGDRSDTPDFALSEPTAVAVHALDQLSGVGNPGPLLVIGAGPIGLLGVMIASAEGVAVSVVEPVEARRDWAAGIGASEIWHPSEIPADSEFGAVLECSGTAEGLCLALNHAEPGAKVVMVGVPPTRSILPLDRILDREIHLLGTVGHRRQDVQRAVELIHSRVIHLQNLGATIVEFDDAIDAIRHWVDVHPPGKLLVHIS